MGRRPTIARSASVGDIIDFEEKRKGSIEQKKRAFERVLFKDFLGSYAEIDESGTKYDVGLVDVSKDGLQFQIPFSANAAKHFPRDKEVSLRVYFTHHDFLPLSVKILHANEYIDEEGLAYWRCGGAFDKTLPSFSAFEPFIDFIYKFAEFSCTDKGESKVYFL